MRPHAIARLATTTLLAFALTSSASASSPGTSYIFPAGAQRGTTVRVIVGGRYLYEACAWNMLGTGVSVSKQITLAERQVWFEGPRIPMPASQSGEAYPKDQLGTVTVAPDAALGHRYYQAWTSEGVTPGRRFVIGHLPEVIEAEIDGRPIPIAVKVPVTINGRIFPREDVDIWTFAATKGRSYVLEVNAARIGSPLDSRIEILGPDGQRVAENTDHFGNDSFLKFTAAADGTYQVRIHDLKFLGLQTYVYRLTITDGPWVEQTYPLGVQRGATTSLLLLGQNLPSAAVAVEVPAGANKTIGRSLKVATGQTNVVSLAVSDHPNVLETLNNNTPASAQPVTLPAVLNGRIETVGDTDHFVFEATKGQALVMDLQAARLGSPLDAQVAVLDDTGKRVAGAEDAKGTSDPTFTFKAPADGKFTVVVSEQETGRGGERFAYRLEIAPPVTIQPGFQVNLPGDAINVPRNAEAKFKVTVTRRGGFNDEIALGVEGLPPGVTLSGGDKIPKGKSVVEMKLKASPDARVTVVPVRITGTAKVAGADVTSTAILAAGTIHDFVRESMKVAVSVPAPFKFTGVFESKFGPQGTTFYRRYTIIRNDFKGPLTATIADTQGRHLQGVSCKPMAVPDGTDQFDFQIQLPPWLEVGRTSRTQMLLVGTVVDPDGTRHKVSFTSNTQSDQTVVLATSGVVGVNTQSTSIIARPGGTVELPFTVSRGTGAGGAGTVELVLPAHIRGVSATPIKLVPGQSTGSLAIRFAKSGLGPFNQPLKVRARIVDARGNDLVGETQFEVVVD